MALEAPITQSTVTARERPAVDVVFGVNEVRLNGWQWVVAFVILALIAILTPKVWKKVERFETGPDYRIPYELSKDYWLYARRLDQKMPPESVPVIGDSVVWGEYVLPDGTLSHFLNQEAGSADKFVNAGVNGMFPLAEEGLVQYYARSLRGRKVIVHCNVLWMSSPKADLSSDKEEQFNHSQLVPQFFLRIPCYKAGANDRLSAMIQNHVDFIQWVSHLQNAYFGQKSILSWTLEDDGGSPPKYPNVYKNPLSQITMVVPAAQSVDPQRGPASPRHRAWTESGQGPARFDWVGLDSSLQWHAFQRLVSTLRARGNDVLVVLGPFNEHMIAADSVAGYAEIRKGIVDWFAVNKFPTVTPEALPSGLYADASHPLTGGYQLLAQRLFADEKFQAWWKK